MSDEFPSLPLIRTKLYRPPVPSGHVHRPHLLEQLEKKPHQPLTVVSAPAGYGKSTLVSCWVEECKRPSAWLSLDEHDNVLHQFLSYFVAAVQAVSPKTGRDTQVLLNAPTVPPLSVLAATLVNELDQIDQDFIIVLDDIHRIHEKAVHDFLKLLLDHPLQTMQLVVIGRRDPMLPIGSLRAKGLLSELRMRDLRFTADEVGDFLQRAMGRQIEESTARALAKTAEGWVTGLRLVALAARGHKDPGRKLLELKGTTAYVMEYLLTEVLDAQSPPFRELLLGVSILDRFCAPLCDALFGADPEQVEREIDGEAFLARLQKDNLFHVSLDMENYWFRYHHLFQDLLQRHLRRHRSPKDIEILHLRAIEWFEGEGLISEAIKHAAAAGQSKRAIDIIERRRHIEYEVGSRLAVENWLNYLPAELRRQSPLLLLTEAWNAFGASQVEQIPLVVEQVESLLDEKTADPHLLAELNFFRGNTAYWIGDAETSVRYLEAALSSGAELAAHVTGNVELMLALARVMLGQEKAALQALNDLIGGLDSSECYIRAYLKGGLAFTYLISGEINPLREESRRMQYAARKANTPMLHAWSFYLEGIGCLHACDLEGAARLFEEALRHPYYLDTRALLDAFSGLALAQQLQKQPERAKETVDRLLEFARETDVPENMSCALSCQARLALLRGELEPAVRWALSISEMPIPSTLFMWLEAPLITQARVLIAAGSGESLEKATKLLAAIRELCEACRFTCQTIEVEVLQSLALEKQGRADKALEKLKEALALAEPGGWIRPFVELGPPMADLLTQLRKQQVSVDYINGILAAFPEFGYRGGDLSYESESKSEIPESTSQNPNPRTQIPDQVRTALVDPLTHRELDVLEQLSGRLQNKEIAEKLSISPVTVKSHLRNIYEKLCVEGRREAVAKAKALGIVP